MSTLSISGNPTNLFSQSGAGSACTQVITEYRDAWPDQSAPYCARIHFLAPGERRKILNEHFADVYNLRVKPPTAEEEEEGEDEARLKTADGFFAALLAERKEFIKHGFFDQDAVLAFFNSATCADDSFMLVKIYDWMDELLAQFDPDSHGVTDYEASTADELSSGLEPFITAVDPDETGQRFASLWPLIHHIEYGHMQPPFRMLILI